ncbi:MAG: alpha-1,2-fucosyltransferase [Oscillospiraceae bacterium]
MIFIKVQGGLGNQISQYACSRLMKHMYPTQEIRLDLSWFDMVNIQKGFELDKVFNKNTLKFQVAKDSEILKLKKQIAIHKVKAPFIVKAVNYALRKCLKRKSVKVQTIESGYPVDKWFDKLDTTKSYYLDGFWHNCDYSDIMETLRRELEYVVVNQELNKALLKKVSNTNSVSVHIRKGDYKALGADIVTTSFYKAAIELINDKVENTEFFAFSDDLEDTKQIFKDVGVNNYTLVDANRGESSYMDMYLMQHCKHNIIANSTFSYWAAQLNDNPDKIVIRPKMQTAERKTWEVFGWKILEN